MVFLPILDAMDDIYAGRRLLKPPVQMFLDMFFFQNELLWFLELIIFGVGFDVPRQCLILVLGCAWCGFTMLSCDCFFVSVAVAVIFQVQQLAVFFQLPFFFRDRA